MSNSMNCAEKIDQMNKGVAWGMFICGITYFITAAEKLVEPGTINKALDYAGGIGVLLTLVITLIACFPVIKIKIGSSSLLKNEPESFMTDTMHKSFKNSWIVTMMFLVLLLAFQNIIDDLNIAPSFYFIVLFGFMTLTASISFLFLSRDNGQEEEL